MRLKAQAAQSRGAAAIVFVPNPSFPKAVDPPRMPPGWFLPAEEGSVPLLAVLASVEVGAALVTPEGRSLADAETALAAGGRPADVGVVGATARLRATAAPETLALRGENLFAVLPGTDLADEWIVVGAHYDHIGIKDIAGDNICNGADDNASGSAMVLGLARALASRSEPPRRTVVFAWFDAEEAGLLGSSTALLQGDLPVDKLVGMVNFDMLGRNPDKPVRSLVSGFDPSPVYAAARARHLRLLPLPAHKGHSDIVSFYKVGVPVVGFFTGRHPDYHMPSDEAGTLDYARMERIGGMAWDLVVALADGEWSPTAARKRRSP
jgi:hypothetical protein